MAQPQLQLTDFPNVFTDESGKVDQALLRQIYSIREKPGKSVRELLATCGRVNVSADEAFIRLSEFVVRKDFRERWYEESDGKITIWSLYSLAHRYVANRYKNLDFQSEQLSNFYTKKPTKSKSFLYFPKLEQIQLLIEQVEIVANVNVKDAAIYCWATIEAALWCSRSQPTENSLRLFQDALLLALKNKKMFGVLALLESGKWNEMPAAVKLIVKPISLEVKKVSARTKQYLLEKPKHENISKAEAQLEDIERNFQAFDKQASILSERSKELKDAKSIADSIEEIQYIVDCARRLFEEIVREEESVVDLTFNSVGKILRELKISLSTPEIARLSPANRRHWLSAMRGILPLQNEIFLFSVDFAGKRKEVHEKFISSLAEKELELDQVSAELVRLSKDLTNCELGIVAQASIHESIKNNYKNLNWNPLINATSLKVSWTDFGRFLIRERSFGMALGIVLRHSFITLKDDFLVLMVDAVSDEFRRIDLEKIIESFNCLTLGQIENIARESEELWHLLAIIELQAFLQMTHSAPGDAFNYWSIAPLNEISSSSLENSFVDLFQSIYSICAKTSDRLFDIAQFRLVLVKANATDEQDRIQLDEEDHRIRLEEALRFYKRGQNTYGVLWTQAYATVLMPLVQYAKAHTLSEIVEKIFELRDSFSIENHLSDWKLHIPEHLRKRSEYDKHIRAQVENKISELVQWAYDYKSTMVKGKPAENSEIGRLEKAVRNVYTSQDSGSDLLRLWFENILLQDRDFNRIPWSFTTSEQPNWDEVATGYSPTPFNPRSYPSETTTVGSLFGDNIIQYFGHNTVPELAMNYADLGLFEEYFALGSSTSEPISFDLDRRVELEVDQLEIKQSNRIERLIEKQLVFSESGESIDLYVSDLREFLTEKNWSQLERELTEVEVLALDMESNRADKLAREQIGQEIENLGGVFDRQLVKAELLNLRDSLYNTTLPKRKHLDPIRRILEVSEMDSDIVNSARAAYKNLDDHLNLPTQEQSEYLAYILEQMTGPLLGELVRYRTLLPSYSSKLKSLTINLMSNLGGIRFNGNETVHQIAVFETMADDWADLPRKGEEGIDLISSKFIATGLIWSELISVKTTSENFHFDRSNRSQVAEENLVGDSSSIIVRFIQKLKSISGSRLTSGHGLINLSQLNEKIKASNWYDASNIAYRLYLEPGTLSLLQQKEVLTNWAVCTYLYSSDEFDVESMAGLFRLINSNSSSLAVQYILPTKNSRGLLGEFLARFIKKIALLMGASNEKAPIQDQISTISGYISAYSQYKIFLRIAFAASEDGRSLAARAFWDHFAGDPRQAEVRAAFMTLVWKSSLPNILAQCLMYPPIDISPRKAAALASVADQILETGKFDLVQSFMDMRTSVSAKPFELFVASMLSMVPASLEPAAELTIVGRLNKVESSNTWRATLSILPRKSDCPDTINLTLEQHSPVRFVDGKLEYSLIGPFFEPTVVPLEFVTNDSEASLFTLEVTCDAISITGKSSRFTSGLNIDLSNSHQFRRLSAEEIEEAFSYFPEYQMRGNDYVIRIEDERKIEKALFGRTVRSLWISSPRRSGKTTMLYRILDAFSHKVGRDSIVVYLTLDKSFTSVAEFNSWVWTRLRTLPANVELRRLYQNFEELGRRLPWDADAGTFINALSDCLLSDGVGSRIVFLIDEIDKFAAMYYANGLPKDTANEIMWQLRHLIGERRDIGFVFAGSSAARRIFVTNSDAPFFNGISLLELTPFTARTSQEESCSREIVEPVRTHSVYSLPKPSLEHLIWVCAGIPYYMKLVSGATMAVARQSHILISDINDGLRALLQRGTGVMKLDEMSGEPGSDELRTMALETGQDKLLTLAVLYSIAESYSALGGQPISRVNVSAQDSPLITRYQLPRRSIERGLDLCIELGFLKISAERYGDIEFSIPILGESIRNACGRLWGNIDHELRSLVQGEQ